MGATQSCYASGVTVFWDPQKLSTQGDTHGVANFQVQAFACKELEMACPSTAQ